MKKCNRCERTYSPEEWATLPFVGRPLFPWGEEQEMRNCTCGSTLAIVTVEGTPEKTTRLFVYGTLLCGEANHKYIQHVKVRRREVRTGRGYVLFDLGAYPGMIRLDSVISTVLGEVYEVDEGTLAMCDRLEGHPTHYRRTEIDLADGSRAETYLLARRPPNTPVIVTGSWKAKPIR